MVQCGHPVTDVQLWETWDIFMQHRHLLWKTAAVFSSHIHTHAQTHSHTHIYLKKPHGTLYNLSPTFISCSASWRIHDEFVFSAFTRCGGTVALLGHSGCYLFDMILMWMKKSSYFLTAPSGKPQILAAASFSSGCSSSPPSLLALRRKTWNIYQGIMFWMLESKAVALLAFLITRSMVGETNLSLRHFKESFPETSGLTVNVAFFFTERWPPLLLYRADLKSGLKAHECEFEQRGRVERDCYSTCVCAENPLQIPSATFLISSP